jgi:hypothetical protein
MTLDELVAIARPAGPQERVSATVVIPWEAEIPAMLVELFEFFGEDRSREAVRLVARGKDAGLLPREALYEVVELSDKGLGTSAGADLPGTVRPGRVLRLCCPVAGCGEPPVLAMDVLDPPSCPHHPDRKLEPCRA